MLDEDIEDYEAHNETLEEQNRLITEVINELEEVESYARSRLERRPYDEDMRKSVHRLNHMASSYDVQYSDYSPTRNLRHDKISFGGLVDKMRKSSHYQSKSTLRKNTSRLGWGDLVKRSLASKHTPSASPKKTGGLLKGLVW